MKTKEFQFLLVRLKDPKQKRSQTIEKISIPSGAIKSLKW